MALEIIGELIFGIIEFIIVALPMPKFLDKKIDKYIKRKKKGDLSGINKSKQN